MAFRKLTPLRGGFFGSPPIIPFFSPLRGSQKILTKTPPRINKIPLFNSTRKTARFH